MNRAFLILLASTISAFAANPAQTRLFTDGTYLGMEPMVNLSPDEPKARWFHENTLVIRGDTVTLNKSPVWFKDGEKFFSASDGGFYTYRGTLSFVDGQWRVTLLLTDSDYVGVRVNRNRKPLPPKPQRSIITRTKDGSLLVGEVTYRKSKRK
jgi:hypothetical protein